jgi:hypothetical protein
MIEAMADDIKDFPGEANHVCCFNHVINLVAKVSLNYLTYCCRRRPRIVGAAREETREVQQMVRPSIPKKIKLMKQLPPFKSWPEVLNWRIYKCRLTHLRVMMTLALTTYAIWLMRLG